MLYAGALFGVYYYHKKRQRGEMMRNFVILAILTLISVHSYAEDLEICLNAIVSNSPVEYSASLNVIRRYGGRALYRYVGGHASVSIYNKKSKKTFISYGYHPDGDLWVNSPNDTPETMLDFYDKKANFEQYCLPAKIEYLEQLESLAVIYYDTYGPWAELNNCVNFAGRLFSEITGDVSLNPQIPLPILLLKQIQFRKKIESEENDSKNTGV